MKLLILASIFIYGAVTVLAADDYQECLDAESRLSPLVVDVEQESGLEGKVAALTSYLAQLSFYFPEECEKPRKAKRSLCKALRRMNKVVSRALEGSENASTKDSAIETLERLERAAGQRGCRL